MIGDRYGGSSFPLSPACVCCPVPSPVSGQKWGCGTGRCQVIRFELLKRLIQLLQNSSTVLWCFGGNMNLAAHGARHAVFASLSV